jgi:hypothetical protein
VTAYFIWPDGFVRNGGPKPASGGILLFVDKSADPLANPVPLEVATHAWNTDNGNGMVELVLKFPASDIGRRFYIVTSGQYRVKSDADPNFFCDHGGMVTRDAETLKCHDGGVSAVTGLEYRLDDQLGVYNLDGVHSVIDRVGYDNSSADVVTGIFARGLIRQEIYVYIPTAGFEAIKLGAADYQQFAPFLVGDSESGSGGRIRNTPPGVNAGHSLYADGQTGEVLEDPRIVNFSFDFQERMGARQVQWANPPTASFNSLTWKTEGGGIAGIEYQLSDPFRQNSVSQNSFLAGVAVSMAAAALLLLLERSLMLWSGQD